MIIICLIIINYEVAAQSIIPRFENLSINDGLPHSSVYTIIQDRKGFMWFGTPDGLCRYDGNVLNSYKYDSGNQDEVTNNTVRGKIQEDKKGNVWYSNQTGIYKWDAVKQKVAKVFSFENVYLNSDFSGVYIDKEDNFWLLNIIYGVARYNTQSNQLTVFPLPSHFSAPNVQYSYSTVDDEGNMWLRVVTANEPFLKFNKKTGAYSSEYPSDPPHAIFFAKDKQILAYEDKLVIHYSGKKETVIPKSVNGKVVSFFSFDGLTDSHHRIWMTARGSGLYYYNELDGTFHQYHHDNSKLKSLPFDLTTCLYIDRSDNLWIGIDGGGVAKIDLKQPKFNLFPLSEGDYPILKDYFTKCFYEDDKQRIWFGSHNNGFSIFTPSTGELINYKNQPGNSRSLPGNSVATIYKDTHGNMWIGTNAGMSVFNEKTNAFTAIPIQNLPPLQKYLGLFVYKFVELKNGSFVGTTSTGLVGISLKPAGYEGIYYGNKNFLESNTTDLVEMDDNTVYATMPGSAMFHLKPTANGFDSIKSYFRGVDLRSVRRDERQADIIWVASAKGLIQFNTINEQFKIWNAKNGLANSYVYGSLEDEKHNLWISTNGGLSYLDRTTNHIDNYSFQDGLQSNEFNTHAFYKSKTNTFYFGGIKGFNWFQSKEFVSDPHKPQIAITELEIDNTFFPKDSVLLEHSYIKLPYDKNDLHFKFAALDYSRPEANKIQYKLEGWDPKWIITYSRSARYSNLPPGEYTMVVKASNAAGVWSDEERIKLIIQQPFWQQDWFYFLLVLVAVLVIVFSTYSFVQQRVKQKLRKLEKQTAIDAERIRISADMHDEIGNGLTHIALLSELIQTQHNPSTDIKKDISSISTSAGKLVQTMSEIIWALTPQNDTLDNLLAYIREQCQQYFEGMNVDFTIDFPEVLPNIKLTNEERRNLFLVTKEALANAMKHAHATSIHLSLVITTGKYCFNVTDDGDGMNANKLKLGSNGLKNMRKRMEDINGSIEWKSAAKGTIVEYCLLF